jgi:hypothetical protein
MSSLLQSKLTVGYPESWPILKETCNMGLGRSGQDIEGKEGGDRGRDVRNMAGKNDSNSHRSRDHTIHSPLWHVVRHSSPAYSQLSFELRRFLLNRLSITVTGCSSEVCLPPIPSALISTVLTCCEWVAVLWPDRRHAVVCVVSKAVG